MNSNLGRRWDYEPKLARRSGKVAPTLTDFSDSFEVTWSSVFGEETLAALLFEKWWEF